jgi:hypothetical protein
VNRLCPSCDAYPDGPYTVHQSGCPYFRRLFEGNLQKRARRRREPRSRSHGLAALARRRGRPGGAQAGLLSPAEWQSLLDILENPRKVPDWLKIAVRGESPGG